MHRLDERVQVLIAEQSGLTDEEKYALLKQYESDIVRTSIIKSFSDDEKKLKALELVEDENLRLNIINQNVVIIDFFEGFIKNHSGGLDEETKFVEFSKVNPEKAKMIEQMKKTNKNLLETIDMRILDLPLDLDSINQISCYTQDTEAKDNKDGFTQEKIIKLNEMQKKVFCTCVKHYQKDDERKEEQQGVLYKYEEPEAPFEIKNMGNGRWLLTGNEIERAFNATRFNSDEADQRFARKMRVLGVDKALREAGCEDGDIIVLCNTEFEFVE